MKEPANSAHKADTGRPSPRSLIHPHADSSPSMWSSPPTLAVSCIPPLLALRCAAMESALSKPPQNQLSRRKFSKETKFSCQAAHSSKTNRTVPPDRGKLKFLSVDREFLSLSQRLFIRNFDCRQKSRSAPPELGHCRSAGPPSLRSAAAGFRVPFGWPASVGSHKRDADSAACDFWNVFNLL